MVSNHFLFLDTLCNLKKYFYQFAYLAVVLYNSISESLAALNRDKSTASSCHAMTNGQPVSYSRVTSAQTSPGCCADLDRVIVRESALKPLNTSSSLDSSVQMVIEKMHSGLEVCSASCLSSVSDPTI